MDLTGKFLVVWLATEGFEALLGVQAKEEWPVGAWKVGGGVEGEVPAGLWLRIGWILRPDGQEIVPVRPPSGEEIEEIYLLRWDTITTARLFTDVPPDPNLPTGLYL